MTTKTNQWMRVRRVVIRLLTVYLPVSVLLLVVLLPYYWMLAMSLKPYPEMFNYDKFSPFWPSDPTLDHYKYLFQKTKFWIWFKNSGYVAAVTTAVSLTISTLAAYSLARLRFRGNVAISLGVFISYLVPGSLLFIPAVQIASWLGLVGRQTALLVFYPVGMIPFAIWVLMAYFQTIPPDLEECAMVDGATRLQALRRIVLPLALPGLITVGIYNFTSAWNEFLYSMVLVYEATERTLPVALTQQLAIGDHYYWGPLMAAAFLAGIPVVVLYSFVVDKYVSGLTGGAVKG